MKTSPCAKINLGLNIVGRRNDGYHCLETVFYPIRLNDEIEIQRIKGDPAAGGLHTTDKDPATVEVHAAQPTECRLRTEGTPIDGDAEKNLVVRAYRALAAVHPLPPVSITLRKHIPMQAGLGGGSADAAFTLTLLNRMFGTGMNNDCLRLLAARLGADCAFFVDPCPAFATGIGEELTPIDLDLSRYEILIVKPPVSVSTREAFANISIRKPLRCCRDIVKQPIETWRAELENDFEKSIFPQYPVIGEVKQKLYDQGAVYAAMSGSGSAVFGIFERIPEGLESMFAGCTVMKEGSQVGDNPQEVFPVVDDEGCTIGRITRQRAHDGSKILHPVVHLHVFNSRGELYLQHRPAWKDIQPDKWDTACGGHVAWGESIEAALQREAFEELGISGFKAENLGKYVFEGTHEREFVYVFRTCFDGIIRPNADELADGRFWSRDEILTTMGKGVFTPNFEDEYKSFFKL